MKLFKNILIIAALCTISSINPMESTTTNSNKHTHSYPPQRLLPATPSTPSPIRPTITNSYPPQRALPTPPSTQNFIEPTTTSSSTQDKQFNTNPPQRALPTPPSTQNPIATPVQSLVIEQKKSNNTNENTLTPKSFALHNLIMLLDPEKTETIQTQKRLLVQDTIIALYEKAAPIIITSNILEIIATLKQKIGENNLQKLQTSSHHQIRSSAEQLCKSHNLHESPFLVILLSLINFDNKNFICYFHSSEDLILIIPKQYIENVMNISNLSPQDIAKECGFNSATLIPTNDLTTNNIIKQLNLQQSTLKNKNAFINNLTSLFVQQKKAGEFISATYEAPWAIYISGHGGNAYRSMKTIREELEINTNNFKFYHKIFSNNNNDLDAKKNLDLAYANIKKYKKILQNKSDWPDSQLVVGAAQIAGLSIDDFALLMKFFNQKLYVYFLHYTSCFAGGYNQTIVNEILSSLDVNFITSAQGLDERETTGVSLELKFNPQPPYISLSKKPFSAFFKVLKIFIDKPEEFIKVKRGKQEQEPFAYVLSAIVANIDQHNQPFIRFPGVGIFGALSLGKKTKSITDALVKAHEIENTPIDLSNTNINIVTISPSRINIPINFGKNIHCSIVSPTPAIIKPAHEAIHIFKEINFENTVQSLVFNLIAFNARTHAQTFIIKNLKGILYPESGLQKDPRMPNTIHNLILQIKGVPGQNMRAYGDVAFELNGSIYQCPLLIKNFEDPNLKQQIQSLKFSTTTNMESLSNKFLTPQEITKLTTSITLETITEFFNTKIDTQQPSLKETAVKKELTEFVKEMPKTKKRAGK